MPHIYEKCQVLSVRIDRWKSAPRTCLTRLAGLWIARAAKADPAAVRAVDGLTPAVVVCGGSRGIGLAIAAEFLRDGAAVVLVARGETGLADAKARLTDPAVNSRARLHTIVLDVTAPDAPERLAAELTRHSLYADILVASAGIGLAGRFTAQSPTAVDALIALNITAATRLIRACLPGMIARARGGILAVSSLGGYVPGPNQAAYYASKAYLCSLAEAVGTEIAGSGVRITVLAPGPVNTSFHAAMGAEHALYRSLMPGLSPARAASAAVWGFSLGRRVVVPGLLPKVLAVCVSILPHWVTAPFVRLLLATPPAPDCNNQK